MDDAISAVRGFNRFFTRFVGALDANFLGTEMSLAEARLLFEIARAERPPVAADLQAALEMDPGFVSRVLGRFETRGWIARGKAEDGRLRPISLTDAGREAFATLDGRQRAEVVAVLERLAPSERGELVQTLRRAQALLEPQTAQGFTLRTFRRGDMGMIAARQSIIYRDDYDWGPGIEVNIGETTAAFLRGFKPGREQCWIAEIDGRMAGSVMLTDEGQGLSRLRLLYVEPFARGLGVGQTLVKTCIGFARETGYERMTLWTHTILESARRIYAANGFRIVEVETHDTFGKPLQGETWELQLKP